MSATTPTEAMANLALLVDTSLISSEIDGEGVIYRLVNTTRRYCLEWLMERGDHAAVRRADLRRARARQVGWAQRPAADWGASYGRVIDDLRGALDWTSRDVSNGPLRIRLTLAGILCR